MNDLGVIEKQFGDLSRFAQCPLFWASKPQQAMSVIESLKQAVVATIGHSAGGRDIIAIEYGRAEPIQTTTDNLHSAMAASIVPPDPTNIYPTAFYGAHRRSQQVLVIQGGIHGGELTGTVASINLCHIIETGHDLRGKPWPRLAQLAGAMHIIVIPWLNPDGVARWPLANPTGASRELMMVLNHGIAADGTPYKYPAVKSLQPVAPKQTAYMGAYYNDNGVNLQYDFCSVDRQPETVAWMRYYLSLRPDAVLVWHCNAGTMIGPPEYYLPAGHQHEFSRVGGAVGARLLREGYEVGRTSWAGLVGMGKPFMEQSTATYHVCGALPLMCELPCGGRDYKPNKLDDLLDIGLITIEEVLAYASRDGLRPYELWGKVKKTVCPTEPKKGT